MSVLSKLFTRRWFWTTIFVLLGMVFMAGLGVWQLDRRAQRVEYNALVIEQWENQPFQLNTDTLPDDVVELEYRQILAEGQFDFENQIGLNNQFFGEQPGIQLITPFVLDSGASSSNGEGGQPKVVLVARGWVTYEESAVEEWPRYDEPELTEIVGLAQETQVLAGETPPAADERLWHRVNVDLLDERMPYDLLPFFIYQLPEEGRTNSDVPVRIKRHPWTHLRSPMMHTSYAIQWFSFALIFGFGYTQLIRVQERRIARRKDESDGAGPTLSDEMMTV